MSVLLEVRGLTKQFKGLRALSGLDMQVGNGEIVGLVGPNGAGKTTAFNLISGALPATSGEVRLAGQSLNGLLPHQVVGRGLARTFQATNLFTDATVIENVLRGLLVRTRPSFWGAVLRSPRARSLEQEALRRAHSILSVVGLTEFAHRAAASLPYGHQRSLGVAIALASEPRLLLLDEPAAGLNPAEGEVMGALVRRVRDEFGISVLLVEHNMRMVMGVCQRIVVLHHGEKLAEGTAAQIQADPRVVTAYLGSNEDHHA